MYNVNANAVGKILEKSINLKKLAISQPNLFDFSKLNIEDKIHLIRCDHKVFLDIFEDKFSVDDKVSVIVASTNEAVKKRVTLSDEELTKVSDSQYYNLLQYQFEKYIRVDLFNKLPKILKRKIFMEHTKWVFENISPLPPITSDVLDIVSKRFPGMIEKYVPDLLIYSTRSYFWINMIKYNKKYKKIFLRNTKSLITKTDVRSVVYHYPDIIKLIDEDVLSDSKLTVKEWVLLCNTLIGKYRSTTFSNWDFSDSIKEIFKMDSLAELLTGRSKMTNKFKNAIDCVLNNTKEEVEADEADAEAIFGAAP